MPQSFRSGTIHTYLHFYSADIDQLITITGMVTRTSTLIPEMRLGFFQCSICNFSVESEVDRGR